MTNTQTLYALLDQTGWIHALARRLVADPHLADDLAQDTWVDALAQPPASDRPLRGWLATVMRHNLSKLRRSERHRGERERSVSREERQPPTLDVVEKAATHRDVVLAVLALDEPYRSTLLMRFFEQLSYREIAQRTGLTRAAVNSRVTRGLEELRAKLENTYGGDRRALYLALAPLAQLPTGVASTILGVKTMHVAIGTLAATLLTVTISVGLSGGGREPSAPAVAEELSTTEIRISNPLAEPPPVVQGERTPLVAEVAAEVERSSAPEQQARKRRSPAPDDPEEKTWKTELFHARVLPASIENLAVNATSGDIEVLESQSGRLEVDAKVRAKLGKVAQSELTQLFEDHVKILEEEEGTLSIEDKHEGSDGWSVSFVVRVPGGLPLSVNSGSGDILVRRAQGRVQANTGSGDVKVSLPGERVEGIMANTGSGDVEIEVLSIREKLGANTGSGDVTLLVLDALSPGHASLNTGSGDVLLLVPPGVVGSFDLKTHGDRINLPRGLGIQVQKDGNGKLSAVGSIGSGGGGYKLSSGSGELTVEFGSVLPM